MTLNSTGSVVDAQDYYPYGGIVRSTAMTDDRFKFTGRQRDAETNYDYFGARYYDSEIGRWMSVDPMAAARPGLTPYNYCQNNPLRFTDLKGMLDGEYWSETGAPLGNDGVHDNKNYVVFKGNEEKVNNALGSEKDKGKAKKYATLLPNGKALKVIKENAKNIKSNKDHQEFGGIALKNGEAISITGTAYNGTADHGEINMEYKPAAAIDYSWHFHVMSWVESSVTKPNTRY